VLLDFDLFRANSYSKIMDSGKTLFANPTADGCKVFKYEPVK